MSIEISEAMGMHQLMNEQNIIMSFMGELNHQTTTSLLHNLKGMNVSTSKADIVTQKRLYAIIEECLDNIVRYSATNDTKKNSGSNSLPIFMLSKKDDSYCIVAGNHIFNDRIDSLVAKINLVNELDRKGLRDYYLQTLAKESSYGKDNAGLGIIDIALKSGNKLEYEFKPVSDKVSFYMIQASIR